MRRFLWLFVSVILLGTPNAWPQETDGGEIIYATAVLESLTSRRLTREEIDAILAETKAAHPERIVVTAIHTCGYATAVFEIIDATTTTPKAMEHETHIDHSCEPSIAFKHGYYFLIIEDEKISLALPIHSAFDGQVVIFVSEEDLSIWEKEQELDLQELREHITTLSPPAPAPDSPYPISPNEVDLTDYGPDSTISTDDEGYHYVGKTIGIYVEELIPVSKAPSSSDN